MAKFLSATDLAIAVAAKAGTLSVVERTSRFGDTFAAISDDVGLIEVADSVAQANERIAQITRKAA